MEMLEQMPAQVGHQIMVGAHIVQWRLGGTSQTCLTTSSGAGPSFDDAHLNELMD